MRHWMRLCVLVLGLMATIGMGLMAQETCTVTVQPGELIQAAIDGASPGDVICLATGEWAEHITTEKSLTVRGEGAEATKIHAHAANEPVITIRSTHGGGTIIENLTVSGAAGIWLHRASGVLIEGNAEATISRCTVSRNFVGITLVDSAQVEVCTSHIYRNYDTAIQVSDSANLSIRRSQISNNNRGLVLGGTSHTKIADCTISEQQITGIWVYDHAAADVRDCTISSNGWDGIRASDSATLMVDRTQILRNRALGIHLFALGEDAFTGYVIGKANTGAGNVDGDYYPENLAFLFTEEGGELDRRE